MNYDVPRQNGLYWVLWKGDETPTVAEFNAYVSRGSRQDGITWEYLYKDWYAIGTDDAPPCPERVLCRAEFPGLTAPIPDGM